MASSTSFRYRPGLVPFISGSVHGSRERDRAYHEDLYTRARAARGEVFVPPTRDARPAEAPRANHLAQADVSREGRATYPPVEAHVTRRAEYLQPAEVKQARRLEAELVQQFATHLEEMGHKTSGVSVPGGNEVIRADLLDRTQGVP